MLVGLSSPIVLKSERHNCGLFESEEVKKSKFGMNIQYVGKDL